MMPSAKRNALTPRANRVYARRARSTSSVMEGEAGSGKGHLPVLSVVADALDGRAFGPWAQGRYYLELRAAARGA